MKWRKALVIVLAVGLLTSGLGVLVYVGVARDRLMPTAPGTGTAVPTWTALPGRTPTQHAYSAAGVVREYSPGALIIVMTPIEGDVEQVIVLDGVRVERDGGTLAAPDDIVPGQTLFVEGALDPLGRLIAARIVIVMTAGTPTPTSSVTASPTPSATPEATIVPTVTPTRTPMSTWEGEYFANPELRGAPAASRDDILIDFDWGTGAPFPGVPTDNFSVRWTTRRALDAGTYRFYASADDGVRVYIDNSLVLDAWQGPPGAIAHGVVDLTAGVHTLRLEYRELTGAASVRVWWEEQGAFPDWRGEYYPNPILSGAPSLVRNDTEIRFEWGGEAPVPGLPVDEFSVRWTRTVLTEAGPHRVVASADDGVRVWVDGILVLDAWESGTPGKQIGHIWLKAGLHEVRVEYVEHSGSAEARVWWQPIDGFAFWRGDYYDNPDLAGLPTFSRDDQGIDFDWGLGSPGPQLPVDNFSVRWMRRIPLDRGRFRLWALADDGVRVLVDGILVIDQWRDGGQTLYEGEVTLEAGQHEVVVEYYERREQALIRFGYVPAALPTATATATSTPSQTPTASATVAPTATATPTETLVPPTATATETPEPTTGTPAATESSENQQPAETQPAPPRS